jgi:PAS domain S-box-containing protein
LNTYASSQAASSGNGDACAVALADDTSSKMQLSYRLLFERNPLPMWVYDVKTLRMLTVNEAALAKYGYSQQEFVALTMLDLHHEGEAAQFEAHLGQARNERSTHEVWQHRHRNGDLIEVEVVTEELELDGIQARLMMIKDVSELRRAERVQRRLARRLSSTLESITDAFFTLDRDWRFTYLNAHAQTLLHRHRDELLGFNIWERFPEAVGSAFQIEYERAMVQNRKVSFETFYAPWAVWLAVDAYPSMHGLTVYFRDVTEKHVAEQRLQQERETLGAIIDSTTDAIISLDAEGRISIFNPAAERIFRRTRSSMLGQSIELLLPERFRSAHIAQRLRFYESGMPSRMMGLGLVKGLRADGQEIDLEGTISQVTLPQQKLTIVSMRDVTERMAVQAEFQQSRTQLSELTRKLMTQEKTLVKRLAQVLHDQLGQTMAAIRMCHETITTLRKNKALSDVDQREAHLGSLIDQAIRQVRQVLVDLRPPLLDEHGLAAALDNEMRNRSLSRPEIDISIDIPPQVELMRWPAEVEYAAFMIGREAVENALRHSGASGVSIRLAGSAMRLQMEVADNGVGIRPGALPRTGHLGILGMQERAHAIGAAVSVKSGENGGTQVCLDWKYAP